MQAACPEEFAHGLAEQCSRLIALDPPNVAHPAPHGDYCIGHAKRPLAFANPVPRSAAGSKEPHQRGMGGRFPDGNHSVSNNKNITSCLKFRESPRFMAMSVQQRRIVRLLHEGFRLRIVRSIFDNSPVYAELLNPEAASIEKIALWRIEKLLSTGSVRPDSGDLATASRLVVTHKYCGRKC